MLEHLCKLPVTDPDPVRHPPWNTGLVDKVGDSKEVRPTRPAMRHRHKTLARRISAHRIVNRMQPVFGIRRKVCRSVRKKISSGLDPDSAGALHGASGRGRPTSSPAPAL